MATQASPDVRDSYRIRKPYPRDGTTRRIHCFCIPLDKVDPKSLDAAQSQSGKTEAKTLALIATLLQSRVPPIQTRRATRPKLPPELQSRVPPTQQLQAPWARSSRAACHPSKPAAPSYSRSRSLFSSMFMRVSRRVVCWVIVWSWSPVLPCSVRISATASRTSRCRSSIPCSREVTRAVTEVRASWSLGAPPLGCVCLAGVRL